MNSHNADNRLVGHIPVNGNPVAYAYDHSGRLLLRTAPNGTKTKFYYDGINQLMVKKTVSGSWRTKKINALKKTSIGQILAHREYTAWSGSTPTAWNDRYYHYDLLGNTTALTDSSGNVAAQYEMEAFGNVKSGGQNGVHLTTKEWDSDSGLYYFNKRCYSNLVGSFLEVAPYPPEIEHPYSFVANSPTFNVDPTGELLWGCTPKTKPPPTPTPTPKPCHDPANAEAGGRATARQCKNDGHIAQDMCCGQGSGPNGHGPGTPCHEIFKKSCMDELSKP